MADSHEGRNLPNSVEGPKSKVQGPSRSRQRPGATFRPWTLDCSKMNGARASLVTRRGAPAPGSNTGLGTRSCGCLGVVGSRAGAAAGRLARVPIVAEVLLVTMDVAAVVAQVFPILMELAQLLLDIGLVLGRV